MSLFPNFKRFTRQQAKALAQWASARRGPGGAGRGGGGNRRSGATGAGASGGGPSGGNRGNHGGRGGSSDDGWLLDLILKRLGPVGQVVAALLRPNGRAAADVQRELRAAQELLEAFGFSVEGGGSGPDASGGVTGNRGRVERIDDNPAEPTSREIREQRRARPAGTEPEEPQPATVPHDIRSLTEGMILVKSSNVHSIGYEWNPQDDRLPGNLLVRFLAGTGKQRSGPGSLYRYKDVPREVFTRFKLAESKGEFVWDELRIRGSLVGHQYDYDLAGIGDDGYVPRQVGFKRGQQGEYYLQRTYNGRRSNLSERQVRGSRGALPGSASGAKGLKFRAGRR